MNNETATEVEVQENKKEVTIPQNEEVTNPPVVNEGVTKTSNKLTGEEIFNKTLQGKDAEVMKILKDEYKGNFDSEIASNRVGGLKDKILNSYSEKKAELEANKKFEAYKVEYEEQQKKQFEDFRVQNNLPEITAEQLEDVKLHNPDLTVEDLEEIKKNPLLTNSIVKASEFIKSKQMNIPTSKSTPMDKETIISRIRELDKIRMESGLNPNQLKEYNNLFLTNLK